jgi:hypothetical protein
VSWSTIDKHWNADLLSTPTSLYRVDEGGYVLKYSGVANNWQQISRYIEISKLVADGEQLYALSNGSLVVHQPPDVWTVLAAPTSITNVVAADGRVWLLREGDDGIWQMTPTIPTTVKIDNGAEAVTICFAGGHLHKLDLGGAVWRYDEPEWTRASDMRASELYGGGDRPYQTLEDDDSLWELPPGRTEWQQIDTALDRLSLTADDDRVFKLRDDGHVLWHSGPPTTGWHDLGAARDEPRAIVAFGDRVYVLTMTSILQHDGPLV